MAAGQTRRSRAGNVGRGRKGLARGKAENRLREVHDSGLRRFPEYATPAVTSQDYRHISRLLESLLVINSTDSQMRRTLGLDTSETDAFRKNTLAVLRRMEQVAKSLEGRERNAGGHSRVQRSNRAKGK
jgi:hypothetical protein